MNYFIHGKQSYLLQQELNKILSQFNEEDCSQITYYSATDADFSLDRILEDVNTISLFAEHKIIVIKNPMNIVPKKEQGDNIIERLDSYLKDSSFFSSLIFMLDEKEETVDKKGKLYKLLIKECQNHEVKDLTEEDFRREVKKDIESLGIQIDNKAFNFLIDRLPLDLANWKNEMKKLALYNQPIHMDEIRHLITRTLEDNTFALSDAVMRKDLKKAMEVWNDLKETRTEVITLIGLLADTYRTLYKYYALSKEMNDDEIAKYLGVSSGRLYHIKKLRGKFSANRALLLLNKLAELDQSIKSYTVEKNIGFELFLVEATSL